MSGKPPARLHFVEKMAASLSSTISNTISPHSEESIDAFIETQKNPRTQKQTEVDTKTSFRTPFHKLRSANYNAWTFFSNIFYKKFANLTDTLTFFRHPPTDRFLRQKTTNIHSVR